MVKANSTGKFCMYTLCASRPCHRGTCVAQSPSKFTCHCPEGFRGQHCEVTLAIYRDDVGLSFSSLFAICICFMALLGIYIQHVLLKKLSLIFIMLPIWFEMNPLFLSNWFTHVILWAYIQYWWIIILIIVIIPVLYWRRYINEWEVH